MVQKISAFQLKKLGNEWIVLDVSALDIGDTLHVRDVTVAEGVRILDDAARVVASVLAPKAEEVAEVTEEEKPAEPEVVGKKEKEEAEAGAEAKEAKEDKKK